MNRFGKMSKIWTATLLCLSVLLLFTGIFIPTGVAIADWQDDYSAYLATLPSTDKKDWYFGADYLNIDGAKAIVDTFLADPNFDKESLQADPIVIAVIDSGIGFAYKVEGESGIPLGPLDVYSEGAKYRLHSIFDDVLLTDEEGNYVYKNVAKTVEIKSNGNVIQTINATVDSGNVACDLVDNTSNDHGTHVTGTVAMLIHLLGLEDYVKILPIKANTFLNKESSLAKTSYLAGYTNSTANPAITEAVKFAYDNGADIVSMSLSATESSKEAFNFTDYTDKMLFVAAAGNTGTNVKTYPAAFEDVIGVMNYDVGTLSGTSQVASKSTYGSWFDISAPGTGIISSINSGAYGKLTGTSMATPMVSFAGALAYFKYRGYQNYGAKVELTTDVIRNMVTHGVTHKTSNALITKQVPALSLTDVLTGNFYGDINFINKIMGEPTGVRVATAAEGEFKLGKGDVVTLSGVLEPTNSRTDDKLYWWYETGGEEHPIGYGWSIDFTIPNAVGMYTVRCALVNSDNQRYHYSSNVYEFSVIYSTPDDVEVEFIVEDGLTSFKTGTTYNFSLPTEDMNPAVSYEVVWYVNGVEKGRGADFSFTPDQEGDYEITLTVNGKEHESKIAFTAVTPEEEPIAPPTWVIVGIVVVATGGLAGIILLMVKIVKHIHNTRTQNLP